MVRVWYLSKHENAATQLGLGQYYGLHSHLQIFLYFFNNVLTSQKEGSQAKVIKCALDRSLLIKCNEWMHYFSKKERIIPSAKTSKYVPPKKNV
jgi:hypothetical protein